MTLYEINVIQVDTYWRRNGPTMATKRQDTAYQSERENILWVP